MRAWLKAGLIGGAVIALVMLLDLATGFLPLEVQSAIGCCTCGAYIVLYLATGALAAAWLTPPRTGGLGAKEGALAGLVAGVISGVAYFISTILSDFTGAVDASLAQLPPEMLAALEQSGGLGFLTPQNLMLISACTIPLIVLWALACGALGGLVYGAAKRD